MAMRDLDGDGTVDSDAGSQHIAEMAKAVVRSQVANSTLQDVLTQREAFRDAVKSKVMQQEGRWINCQVVSFFLFFSDQFGSKIYKWCDIIV